MVPAVLIFTSLMIAYPAVAQPLPDFAVCAICLSGNEQVVDTAFYNGQIYYFCSADCKAEFAAHPELYATPPPAPEWMATVPS